MWKDTESDIDMLGYQVHADLLVKIILQKDMLPTSIGIFGDWGSGKSSLMLLMQKTLDEWISKTNEENKKCPKSQTKEVFVLRGTSNMKTELYGRLTYLWGLAPLWASILCR